LKLLAVSALADVAGGETMLLRLLPELRERGWDVRLTVPGGGRLREAAADAGIPTAWLPVGPPERRDASSYAGVAISPLKMARADVVLLNGLPTQRLFAALRVLRKPAVLHVDNPLKEPPGAWSRRGFWERVRGVVTDSHWSADQCVLAGAPSDWVHAIHPPAWSGKAPPGARATRGAPLHRVGFVGQIEPRKGVVELIEAAGTFLRERPRGSLTILGDSPAGQEAYAEAVRSAVATSEVADRIQLAGFRSDAATAMVEFDLLVVPSLAEPFGTVAAEAAAAGVAVVASDVGGLSEVVAHGETGLLVTPGEPQELAAAVGTLLDDPDALRSFGERALTRAQALFSPAAYAEHFDSLLRAAAAPPDLPSAG
jgi:glycosyltransferase involved in cell wall biosynthesis